MEELPFDIEGFNREQLVVLQLVFSGKDFRTVLTRRREVAIRSLITGTEEDDRTRGKIDVYKDLLDFPDVIDRAISGTKGVD